MRRAATPLAISDGQRSILQTLAHSRAAAHRVVQRARVLLLAADGVSNSEISAVAGVSRPTVLAWRGQFAKDGLTGFGEVATGRGRKPSISDEKVAEIVELTQHSTPKDATHWSCRSMAKHTRVSPAMVGADLVGARAQTSPGEDLQDLGRPAVRGEARRRRGPVPQPARAGRGAVHGREEPDPGTGPHPAQPAAQARPGRLDDP